MATDALRALGQVDLNVYSVIRPPEGVEKVSDLSSESVLSPFNWREVQAAAQAAFGRVEIGRVGTSRR